MFKIAIVEDEIEAAQRLNEFLTRFAYENAEEFVVDLYESPCLFLKKNHRIYDIVFMDIVMPELNGLEAARIFREQNQNSVLVFVTNMLQYAVKGYEVDAIDFLIKPIIYGDFDLKLKRIISKCKGEEFSIVIQKKNGFTRLKTKDIYYIEVLRHKLIFHTKAQMIEGKGTLTELDEQLRSKGFLRCNKCYLVNQRHIVSVQGYTLQLTGGAEIQISRPRKKTFMCELAENLGDEGMLC